MGKSNEEQALAKRLRKRAEDALRGKPVDLSDLPVEDIQFLLHELQVHQVELTLQNEELRRVQLALEIARDQYSDLYNFAPVGYCSLDHKGIILEANHTLAVMLGGDKERLFHKKLSDFVAREDQDEYYLHQQRTFEGSLHQVTEIHMLTQSEERIVVRLESVLDQANQNRILVILSDITARKQVEDALAHYTQELEFANQALRDFSFIASHDLREPLRKVKAFGVLLAAHYGEKLGAEGKDYIARMTSAATRMDSMLLGLLAYSRVTSQSVDFAIVDLHAVAFEVLSDLDARIMETDAKVEIGELPHITADPLQMRLLLQNLISNAIKYHRAGVPPRVSVTSRCIENNQTELIVQDNGIGIDMKFAERIFEPFTRLHGKSEHDGTGMGLAICKKIVLRHNGTISVSSIVDQGSTFTVTLPQ